MNHCTELKSCLACGSDNLQLQLDLSTQALANSYVSDLLAEELTFPLAVNLCKECYHLQLTHIVDPEIIYKNYLYVSGTSRTLRDHFQWFAGFTKECSPLWPTSVLDIGCNDGTQLDYFKEIGLTTYGVDPAENLYPESSQRHHIYCDFYSTEFVDKIEQSEQKFDIITAQNVFAHNPDPLTFLQNTQRLMKQTSLLFIQTSQAEMIQRNEFDTIYHEHISFYNINSMNRLCQRAGMHLVDVVRAPIHGNSYIFVVSKQRGNPYRIANLIAMEAQLGLLDLNRYDQWALKVRQTVESLSTQIKKAKDEQYKIIGYGAAAKGNTLLNYGKFQLDAIIDDNPLKTGLYTPGQRIPIVGIEYLEKFGSEDKIMFVPLAWNFYREIKQRIKKARSSDQDLFVKYFPEVNVEK